MSTKTKTKAKAKTKILPKKMSKLIEIALKDLKKVEASPNMVVSMVEWFNPKDKIVCRLEDGDVVISERPVCSACLAGAVMAFTLGKKNSKSYVHPENMGKNEDQLMAIDCLRQGDVAGASVYLGITKGIHFDLHSVEIMDEEYENIEKKFNCDILDYDLKNPKPFHSAMEKLQKKLAKAGY